MDIVGRFRRSACRHADRVFALDLNESVTYREADVRSDAIANRLLADGLSRGRPLGMCAPDCVSLLVAVLGAWKAGAVPAMIDPRTPSSQLLYFVEDIGADAIVTVRGLDNGLRQAGVQRVEYLESLTSISPSKQRRVVDEHSEASPLYLSYTSGSTGPPKGALLRSGPVTLGTACIADRMSLCHTDRLLVTTPASSSFQLVAAVMPAIHAGASIVFAAGADASAVWQLARSTGATILVGYPLTLSDVVHAPEVQEHRGRFRLALSGGSPLAPRLERDYRDLLGVKLLESYGQSELGGFMALGREHDWEQAAQGYVGPPLPDRPAYVGRPDGEEVAAGEVGEVLVASGFFAGYWNQPDKTSATLQGGVLHTGDLAVANADGYLRVLGRVQERTSAASRGFFIRDLEDALYEHPAVKHAAVVETASGDLVSCVEPMAGMSVEVPELVEYAIRQAKRESWPGEVTLGTMPRTFSGKADRRALATEHG